MDVTGGEAEQNVRAPVEHPHAGNEEEHWEFQVKVIQDKPGLFVRNAHANILQLFGGRPQVRMATPGML